jgi:hypothetical protein
MRILITGGRDYSNKVQMYRILSKYVKLDDEMCHGGALGADSMADFWAAANEIDCRRIPAQWRRRNGDPAEGVRRNLRMLRKFRPELVIAFPGGTGTANMVKAALRQKINVVRIKQINKETL